MVQLVIILIFKTENTPSVEQELYKKQLALEIENQNYDSALALIEKVWLKFPKSSKLTEQKGTVYVPKSGKMDQFMANLKDQVTKNPNDKVSWYNLGVFQAKIQQISLS